MTVHDEMQGWFAGRIPQEWFEEAPSVKVDREEVLIVGRLSEPKLPKDAGEDVAAESRLGRIKQAPRGHPP